MKVEKEVMCFFCRSMHLPIDEDIFKKFYNNQIDAIPFSKSTVDEDGFKMPYIISSTCKTFCLEQSKKFFYNIFVINNNVNLSSIQLIKEQLKEMNAFIQLMKNQNIPQSEVDNFKIIVCLEKNLSKIINKLKNLPKYKADFFINQFFISYFHKMDVYYNFLTNKDYRIYMVNENKNNFIHINQHLFLFKIYFCKYITLI
ncbi:Hypothetical protein SRAE_X000089000 [Strongyloides ratti]|uniref:Uncharacterized protein n=1 Tax=Strongyloides ratti TaxID=34506 RepID=A0A090LP76_STRRB|nr:Hypothetical protein SRAE_X000089000 [Strongyloides ratti]CEF71566.1 Hypothetical protein SRAE_X000089000 [Strongyloides ratti]